MRLPEELRIRCKGYASAIVRFYVSLPKQRKEVEVLGHQLLRSGTSIAAHAREASRARSTGEFCSKLDCLLQEADEPEHSVDRLPAWKPKGRGTNQSQLWLELLQEDCAISGNPIDFLLKETNELIAIFVTIVSKSRSHL